MQYPAENVIFNRVKMMRIHSWRNTYLARCRHPGLSCTSDKINTSTGTRRATLGTTIGTPRPRSSAPSASGTGRCSGVSSPTLRTSSIRPRSTRCRRPTSRWRPPRRRTVGRPARCPRRRPSSMLVDARRFIYWNSWYLSAKDTRARLRLESRSPSFTTERIASFASRNTTHDKNTIRAVASQKSGTHPYQFVPDVTPANGTTHPLPLDEFWNAPMMSQRDHSPLRAPRLRHDRPERFFFYLRALNEFLNSSIK